MIVLGPKIWEYSWEERWMYEQWKSHLKGYHAVDVQVIIDWLLIFFSLESWIEEENEWKRSSSFDRQNYSLVSPHYGFEKVHVLFSWMKSSEIHWEFLRFFLDGKLLVRNNERKKIIQMARSNELLYDMKGSEETILSQYHGYRNIEIILLIEKGILGSVIVDVWEISFKNNLFEKKCIENFSIQLVWEGDGFETLSKRIWQFWEGRSIMWGKFKDGEVWFNNILS